MDSSVLVYSPDEIRCQIISKTLAAKGLEPLSCTTHFEAEQAAIASASQAAVLDFARDLPFELNFREKLAKGLPETAFVVLTRPNDTPILEKTPVPNETHLPIPLDPELVHACLEDAVAAMTAPDQQEMDAKLSIDYKQKIRQCLSAMGRALKEQAVIAVRRLLKTLLVAALVTVGIALGALLWCFLDLPDVSVLKIYSPYKASQVFSHDNQLISELYVERRHYLPYGQIPEVVKNAVIAIEDQRYFQHSGIDPVRIAGALYADIREGRYAQGASTITQQLVKMIFLTPKKTLSRKIEEALLSLQIETMYSKEEILELYLNKAYFGPQSYGITTAAASYFQKQAEELVLAEAALLAGLLKAPSDYSPFKNPELAKKRRTIVLQNMLERGFISPHAYSAAVDDPLPKTFYGSDWKAPYFVDYCKQFLDERIGERLYTSGLKVYTTLDSQLQQAAEAAVHNGIQTLVEKEGGDIQAALLAVEISTGRIKAMVGGRDFSKSQFNRATQALRQPGSAFKPIVYLSALLSGYGPETVLMDRKTTYPASKGRKAWTPKNYTRRYLGEVSMETAISKSLNAATVDLAHRIGIGAIRETAGLLGIQSDIHPVYPSALGASEVTLLELVYAYAAFSDGYAVKPRFIDQIIDSDQAILLQPKTERRRILDETVVGNIRRLLAAVVEKGTAVKARSLNRPVFGKTGTSNNNADALFVGFDDELVVGVWVGRDDNTPIGRKQTDGATALPIWMAFMDQASGEENISDQQHCPSQKVKRGKNAEIHQPTHSN
jgi:penicillin-binding protein 1A